MYSSIRILLTVSAIALNFNVASAYDGDEVEPAEEKPVVKIETKDDAAAMATQLPNDFWIVNMRDNCPQEIVNADKTVNLNALECNQAFRFKELPSDKQQRLILELKGEDWKSVRQDYVSRTTADQFNVNFRSPDRNFGQDLKEKWDSIRHGCMIKRYHGGGGIQCKVKF